MRIYLIAIIVSIVGLLVILAGAAYATGYDKAITTGFDGSSVPERTYIAGVNFGGLDEQTLVAGLTNLLDSIADEELVIWLSEDESYLMPLKELGFNPSPEEVAGLAFAKFPPGFGVKQVALRQSGIRRGLRVGIPLVLDEETLREFLGLIKSNIDMDARDAHLDFENQCLLEAREGRILDIDATIADMPEFITSTGSVSVRPIIAVTGASVSSSDLAGVDPSEPLATFTTKFNKWKRGRCKNIAKLSEMYRGITLKPGEQFSLNEISGPRSRETGYFPAPEFKNNRIIDGYGGGSCQVSTTLYNTALLAGMRIDERYPHSRIVFYVPRGRDATVNYDSKVDLRFTNVLDHPVVIWSRWDIEEGWLTFEIYGHTDDRKEIEITNSYSTIWRTESMDEYVIDRSLAPGEEVVDDKGTNGVRARTVRHYIQPDGTRISEELYYDVIPAMGRIIRHNPSGGHGITAAASSTVQENKDPSEDTGDAGIYF